MSPSEIFNYNTQYCLFEGAYAFHICYSHIEIFPETVLWYGYEKIMWPRYNHI